MTPEHDDVRARMNAGELYRDFGPGLEALEAERVQGKELAHDYNATRPSQTAERREILDRLFGTLGREAWVEPPLHVAYGSHVHVGDDFYANFGTTFVDDADVHVGDRVMFGPHVTITTAGHPLDPELRATLQQYSLPVRIEDDVWLGAHVVVLPGVTVGRGSVVGAGSVVTRDVPPGVVAAGVPCRVLRPLGPQDADTRPRAPRGPA